MMPPPESFFHILHDGETSLTIVLRALARIPYSEVVRAELRNDKTSLVCVRFVEGNSVGRVDIGLYPQKGGTYALINDFSLERFSERVTDPAERYRFQTLFADRIRTEVDSLCMNEQDGYCTF